jgi:hypothetical protein
MIIDIYAVANEIVDSDGLPKAIDIKSIATTATIDAVLDATGNGIHFVRDGSG